jgi:AcrR family transcriptional regulator
MMAGSSPSSVAGEAVPQPRHEIRSATRKAEAPPSSRSKREAILFAATTYFGDHGYEDTKWADVAAAVGIGSTALYHYFESKQHCLYVIMAGALQSFLNDFERISAEHASYLEGLVAILRSSYELTEHEVLRNRVLVAEQGLVGTPRSSQREEEARSLARALTRDLEFAWSTSLSRGMAQGHVPEADPRMLTRGVLGLYNSVWHWYRPRATIGLEEIADFFVRRQLVFLGLPDALADGVAPGTGPQRRRRRS